MLLLAPPELSAQEGLPGVFDGADVLFDGRLRYELADREGLAENAHALTFRGRFGFRTGEVEGFRALVEGDFTRDLGIDEYDSTVNGRTGRPVVADPNSQRLNRLSLGYHGLPGTEARVGRQRIILDDARFVGNVGFRQNEQTYDAVRARTDALAGVELDYAYVWQVNRIFGSESAAGQADADTHLLHASRELPVGTLTGYAYLMDLEDGLAGASNRTYGARFAGDRDVGDDWRVSYLAEYAHQAEFGDVPGDFGLDYLRFRGGAGRGGARLTATWESLEGNGTRGFSTPLATLHAYQGFADVFLTTPARGIEDLQLHAEYRAGELVPLDGLRLAVWFHEFSPEQGPGDPGEELDAGLFVTPSEHVTVALEHASYFGADTRADLSRTWVTVHVRR